MRAKWFVLTTAAVMAAATGEAQAAIIPVGVHNDVDYNTVVNTWGWTVAYRGDYRDSLPLATAFQNVTGQYVMLAGIRDGSTTFDVLAAALLTDVTTYTSHNATHAANGAEWYYNGSSLGFAGLGDTISQTSADTAGLTERDRLSWHTDVSIGQNPANVPTQLSFGWRSGNNAFLNSSTEWDRVILTADRVSIATPEPTSLALLGLGGIGLAGGAIRKRRQRKLAA